MRLILVAAVLLLCSAPLFAQVQPRPESDRQRIQTVRYSAEQPVVLTMLPGTPLTVVLEPGDTISEVAPGPEGGFSVRVSAERDAFTILPLSTESKSDLAVTTRKRGYRFTLQVGSGPEAAVLVRYLYGAPASPAIEDDGPAQIWRYRLKGGREVRPLDIFDDGRRTRITYAPGQPLPAVFAIGATGDEEVVNGYMRDGIFEIDRVYSELVFRIDKEKASARRNDRPGNEG